MNVLLILDNVLEISLNITRVPLKLKELGVLDKVGRDRLVLILGVASLLSVIELKSKSESRSFSHL